MTEEKISVLVIYTGGTIGMTKDQSSGALVPFNFGNIYDQMPVLKNYDYRIDFYAFDNLIDSSNMKPTFWISLAQLIEKTMNFMMDLWFCMAPTPWPIPPRHSALCSKTSTSPLFLQDRSCQWA